MAFEIIASLNVGESAKEISEKIKSELNPKVNADKPLRLIGNLDIVNTKKQIEQELQKITGLKIPEISTKINTTNITQSLDNVRNQTSKITNEMVAEFNKMAAIPSKVQGMDKSSFNSQIKNLLGDFKNGDIETSKNALAQLTKIIDEQSRVVMQDKSNIEHLREELRQLGKVHIDTNLQKDLDNVFGDAKKIQSVLTTLFGAGGGYNYTSGAGDISNLFDGSATLSRFTTDAEGLKNIYEQLQNMKKLAQPQSIFDVGGLSKAEADMRSFLSTIVGVPNYILETERATDSLNKKLNEQSMVLRLTQSEFEVLRNTKFNNVHGGVYNNFDGTYSLVDDLNRIRAVIVETENTAKQASNTNKVIQALSNSFSNLQGNFIKPLKPTIDVSGVIDADKTFKDFQNRFKEFTGVNVSGAFKSVDLNGNIVKQLDKVFVSFKNSNNEAQKFVYTLNETDKMFNFTSASYNDSGVDKQIAKANVEATKLQTTLDGLKAKFSDINSSKPIKSADNIAKLESEYIKVQQAIGNVKKADSQTMTQMIANANSAISAYKSLGNSLKNSEYVASQLRAKDIGTVHQIEIENLKNFEAQIKNSVVPTKELQKDLKKLKNILAQPVSNQSMIDYFNSFDVAKAKFSALKEQYKSNDEVKYYDRLKNAIKEVNKLEAKRLSASGSSTEYSKELDKQLKNAKERVRYNQKQIEQKKLYNQVLNEEVKYLERSLQRELSLKQAEQATKQQQKAEAERIKQQQQATKQQQKDIDSLNKSIDSNISKMNQMSNRAIFRTNANDISVKNMQDTFKRLEADYTKLKSKLSENLTPEALKNLQNQFNALAPEFDRVIQKSKQLDATFRNSNSIAAFNSKINTLRNQIETFMKNNPKALKSGYDTVFNDMLNGLNNCANSQAFNKIKSKFIETRQEINRLGLTGNTVFGTLKEKVSKFASWMGITMATATVAREIRGMFSTIVELDTALVDLNKTFTGTQTELNDFYYSANKIAKSLGVTTTEVINSTSSWQRLGYSIHEAEELAKTTSIFTSISPEMSLDEAQTSMVSIIKGFGIEANNALDGVASKVNIIGNKFALSNSDIAIALQKSASALKSANNTFEESIGLVVAGQEILQDADVVGQGLKTVSARVRGLAEDWQTVDNELVNIKGDIYDLTGVSIMEDEDTFKSTYDILKEISYVWDNITDKEQSNISELLFGKHRLSLGLAILDNFEQAEKAVKTMENSSGNAMEEMTIIYDSLEYKINAFKETITEIAQSTITQDFLKSIVDDGTKMLETFVNAGNVIKPFFDVIAKGVSIIEQLTSSLGGLDKVLAGFAVNKMFGSGFRNLFGVDILKFVPNSDGGFKLSTFKSELEPNIKALKKFDEALRNGTGYRKAYKDIIASTNETTQQQAKEIERVTRQYKMGVITQQQYNSSIKNITTSTRALGVQQKITTAISKTLSVALNSIASIGISLAISAIITGLDKLIVTHKEALEITQENLDKSKEEYETLKENISVYEELGQKTLLTNQEKEQLLNIQDELVKTYGEEAKNIDLINGSYEEQLKLLKQLKIQEVQDLRDNAQARYNEVKKDYNISGTKKFFDIKEGYSVDFQDSVYDKLGDKYSDFIKEIQAIENIGYKDSFTNGDFTYGKIANLSDNIEDNIKAWNDVQDVLRKYNLQNEKIFNKINNNISNTKTQIESYQNAVNDVAKYELYIYQEQNPFREDFTHKQFTDWKNNLINSFGEDEIDIANAIEKQINSMYVEPEIEIVPKYTINKEKIQAEVDKVNLIFSKTELDGETSKNTVFDDLALIEKAMEEASKNGYIARESFEELITVYPELENVAKQTSNGYELSLLQMKNAEDDFLENHKHTIEEAQTKTRDEISLALEDLQKAQEKHQNNITTNQPYTILKESEQELKIAKENYEYLTGTLVDLESSLDKLDYDTQINYLDLMAESCSVASGNMKMLSSAFAEINENGTLSVDTMISLIDSGYASALMYDANTKSVTLNRKQVELLAKTKIQSAKADLEAQLATEKHTEAIRQQIQAQINAYDMMLSQWNNIYDGVYGESPSEINSSTVEEDTTDYYKENAEAQIKALKQQYELGYISSTDYYNQLLDLVNYFYQGKTEYLDEYADYEKEVYDGMIEAQKERLEEQKKKIQEVNEENEKSIELIKAIQDLENAKKNKTIRSYSEERGWEYTTDTEAILEADQKLNQLLQEAKEKIIDKEIDAAEKMNLEELKNALNSPLTSLPTNEDIINTAKQQSLEYITNAINNNNQSMNYSINIQNLNTNNPNDFLNQMSNLFSQLSNDTVLGR